MVAANTLWNASFVIAQCFIFPTWHDVSLEGKKLLTLPRQPPGGLSPLNYQPLFCLFPPLVPGVRISQSTRSQAILVAPSQEAVKAAIELGLESRCLGLLGNLTWGLEQLLCRAEIRPSAFFLATVPSWVPRWFSLPSPSPPTFPQLPQLS